MGETLKGWKSNDFEDREPGSMGTGADTQVERAPTSGKQLRESCEGWNSKSFDGEFKSGEKPDYSYGHDGYNTSDGPAWPSQSAQD